MNILQELKANESLSSVPDPQLQWLAEHSEIIEVEEGNHLYQNGDPVDHLLVVIEGRLRMFVNRNGQHRELGFNEKNYIGGLLPYSRLRTAVASAIALEKTTVLRLHRDKFQEMIATQHELVESFVHLMLDRVRTFTKLDQQNEKMISLGKLSAGLAHELNNPASAVVRSASALKKHLGFVPEKFKKVISIESDEQRVDGVNEVLAAVMERGAPEQTLMERSGLEDELTDWLEDHEVEESFEIAESFAEYGVRVEELDAIAELVRPEDLSAVLGWLDSVLTTEKMVDEIAEASSGLATWCIP